MSERNSYRGRGYSCSSRHDRRRVDHHHGGAHSGSDGHRNSRPSRGGRGSAYQTQERRQGAVRYLTAMDIKALAQSSSADVLACVNDNEAGFLKAYSHDKYCMDSLMMKHLVKLLYLLSKSDDFDRVAPRILARILSADGSYAMFIMRLDFLIKSMIDEGRGHVRRENPQYLNYLIEIGKKAITVIPETVLNTYPLLVIQKTIQDLIRQGENLDTLDQKAKSLEEAFKLAREERSRQMDTEGPESDFGEPPEHFTDVEILPSLAEVHSGDGKIYLRPNVVKGSYSNWDHYLDVQYRLLREDFVRPLRHGIQQYCTPGVDKHSHQDVRIYERVRVLNPVCLFMGIGFEIQFDATRLSRVNWEHSRRLIFGSLLCLSNDNFEQSIIFATVVKRDPSLLKEGRLTVKFEGECSGFHFNPNDIYTMVESTAYFEAYRHILTKLKDISSDEIPFKSYIIGCKLSDIPAPSYSLHQKHIQFDLQDILGVKSRVALHKESSWPSAQVTNLDPSQLDALKMALTKEVSVIQGPPGTGKTFIGLKIVEAFLRNRSAWDRNKEAPILVVCYTNHALDQFLEGIQTLSINEQSPNIIRIGGRCKSEKLSSYILRNKVKEYQTGTKIPRALLRKAGEARSAMFKSKGLIDRQLPSAADGIVPLEELRSLMLPHHFCQLTENNHSFDGREIEVWLDLWIPDILFSQPAGRHRDDESEMVTDSIETTLVKGGQTDGYIEVDNEAKLMEDDRILEGEEIEFLDLPDKRTSGKRVSPDGHGQGSQAKRSKTEEGMEYEPVQSAPDNRGDEWMTVQVSGAKKSKRISEGLKFDPMLPDEAGSVRSVWSLPLKKRWQLYNHWMKDYTRFCRDEARKHTDWYEQACERHSECLKDIDESVLQGSDVIGITTTGAAKHHHVLKKIHPKVVIFEEAAEIFEAHIITSLAPSVQQLVLIGDHKQLQPKPNCYDLEVNYKLSVSLFERLVRNKIPYVTLNVQHRMRPEISRLIHPSIYSDLKDHSSVEEYDSILGVAKNVYVVDHDQPEKSNKDSDVTTHTNVFEAEYLVSLCRYLLKQGYHPHTITILTMYRGQLLELKRKMHRKDFEGVRVAAVDDFQGEENDIILLSLVRSNPEKNIGFLSNSNRTCVALSRAKKGLYIIGNLSMLRGKDKTVWPEIISDLEEQQCVGKGLPLYCRVHKKAQVFASVPEDFYRCSPEGGCDQLCKVRLSCGHHCPRICHPNDRDHAKYKCLRECPKSLQCGHKCRGKCYECSSGCRPCTKKVNRVLPSCRHDVSMPCSADPDKYQCPRLCAKALRCGHDCQNTCSEPCNLKCLVEVEKTLQCGHKVMEVCHKSNSRIVCPEKCNTFLECGHPCVGTCGSCHMGRLHMQCQQDCGRQLVCGHTCNFPCASTCPPCTMPCNNFCMHSQCPKKCYEVCDPCMEPCQWQCKHFRCTQPCGNLCDRPYCNMPCEKSLKCGHRCIGLCGEKCPSQCRVCDKDQVTEVFLGSEDEEDACFVVLEDCEHIFEFSDLDKWFDQCDNSSGDFEVKFPTCPRCKTPVRKSLRYCNKVKETLKDVAEIKRKQLLPKKDLLEKFRAFWETTNSSDHFQVIKDEVQLIDTHLKKRNLHPFRINTISTQISVLGHVLKVKEILDVINRSVALKLRSRFAICDVANISESLKIMKAFVMQEFLSLQQTSEVVSEIWRLSCMVRFCDLLCKLEERTISPEDQDRIKAAVQQIHESGWRCPKLTEESAKSFLDLIEKLSKDYEVCGLSSQERLMIVEAIGLKKGHWFKCRNGHYYCIGECGGAMVKSKCPECGEVIGGQQHRLVSDNVHAPEMDGSSHPAWSEATNLANYQLP